MSGDAGNLLRELRQARGRQAGHHVHFVELNHHDRLVTPKTLGDASAPDLGLGAQVSSVEAPGSQMSGSTDEVSP